MFGIRANTSQRTFKCDSTTRIAIHPHRVLHYQTTSIEGAISRTLAIKSLNTPHDEASQQNSTAASWPLCTYSNTSKTTKSYLAILRRSGQSATSPIQSKPPPLNHIETPIQKPEIHQPRNQRRYAASGDASIYRNKQTFHIP